MMGFRVVVVLLCTAAHALIPPPHMTGTAMVLALATEAYRCFGFG